jgi:uncharacterized membrane protein YgdD (TMEM256/DUF423 family)
VPGFYAWSALVVTGVVAWWLQSPRLGILGGAFAALALAVVPHTSEVYLTICNLQWITALGLFALTFSTDASTPVIRIGELVLLILFGLTGPFVILALPLFIWRAATRRSLWSHTLLAVALVCALSHLPSLLTRIPETVSTSWAPLHHAAIIGRRVVGTLFLGRLPLTETLCIALAFVTITALAWLLVLRRAPLPNSLFLLVAAILVLAATAYKVRPDTWTLSELDNGDRYFFIPKIILLWLLAALAVIGTPHLRVACVGLILLSLISNAPRFFLPPAPDQHWRASCELIARGQPVWVPILPEGTNIFHPGRRPPPAP